MFYKPRIINRQMMNQLIMQYFEWNMPSDGTLWCKLKEDAAILHQKGFTAVWIPPACKAMSYENTGYSIYDLFDLGEFYQKGSVKTKYGSKHELQEAINELHRYGINVYFDTVLNHKAGADFTEYFLVKEVDPNNRNAAISDVYEIEGWTGFNFPGRNNKYSSFKWNHTHFKGIDCNVRNNKEAIYLIQKKDNAQWSEAVDKELGNYDYLMHADIDYNNNEVVDHITEWGQWVCKELNIDGMRLDAVKHIDLNFIKYFVESLRKKQGDKFFFVAEYWSKYIDAFTHFLEETDFVPNMFDVPLHYNLHEASIQDTYDLRNILKDTLIERHPNKAITFVDNHDSEPGSSMDSPVSEWFKPSAYALILLMEKGIPTIFWGDYQANGSMKAYLDLLISIRHEYAYGNQIDYFNNPNTVGFIRPGEKNKPYSGLALLISNKEDESKNMFVGISRSGQTWYDITGNIQEEVIIGQDGYGHFSVSSRSFSVWVEKKI